MAKNNPVQMPVTSDEQAISPTKPSEKIPKYGECCYVDKNGSMSDQSLHDEIMAGVDDQVNIRSVRKLVGNTLSKEELDCLLPLNAPSE